jgi:hypothetical protein
MPVRRIEILLFIVCWLTFAYFNQGGGWNQNSRFSEIRAMAEEGRFAIDDFFVYQGTQDGGEIRRLPVRNAEYEMDGKRYRLCWVDAVYELYPVGDRPVEDRVEKAPMIEVCSSGDVSYVPKTGSFHPNKPFGTSLMALPAYYVIFQGERMLGINPDHWWSMTANVWLTTIFSVGLVSALGCVLFFRLAKDAAGGKEVPAVLATIGLAFGTTFFPFGTILFDHALTAMLLVGSFYFLRLSPRPVIAGACAGLAVVTNYVAAGAVVALGLYALLAGTNGMQNLNWKRAIWFIIGGVPFAGLLMYYNWACFGSPFELNNNFQNPLFKDAGGFLGMFGPPNPYVLALLVASPYRGIFVLAPVLIMGVYGWIVWMRERRFTAETRLGIAIFGWFFLMNTMFNGYHAGFSAGPRYLVPGLPFIALPLVVGFIRWRKTTTALLGLSVFQHFLLTATDAQNSLAVGGHARIDDAHRKDDFFCSIVYEYAWPLFFQGQVRPLLEQMIAIKVEAKGFELDGKGIEGAERQMQLEAYRDELRRSVDEGKTDPLILAAIRGPVSVNPVAVFDGLLGFGVFPIDSLQGREASMNAGEFLFPNSRLSVVPLLVIAISGFVLIGRMASKEDSILHESSLRAPGLP